MSRTKQKARGKKAKTQEGAPPNTQAASPTPQASSKPKPTSVPKPKGVSKPKALPKPKEAAKAKGGSKANGNTKPKALSAPKAKTKPAAKPGPDLTWRVSSLLAYGNDGFHTYEGPGTWSADSSHKSLQAACKRAKELFFKGNPWGLEVGEIEAMDVEEKVGPGGCVSYGVSPEDSQTWRVKVLHLRGK